MCADLFWCICICVFCTSPKIKQTYVDTYSLLFYIQIYIQTYIHMRITTHSNKNVYILAISFQLIYTYI